jgi:HAD superfamily hydrolase (TIGR01549 family)
VEEIRRRYDAAMPRHLHRVRVGTGTEAVLARLGERGLGRAVVTNTQGSLAREVLRTTGLEAHVDVLVAAGEGCREKPHPDLLERALARLGRAPEEARMVGDTDYDEAAARAAGVAFLRFDVRAGGRLAERLAPWIL